MTNIKYAHRPAVTSPHQPIFPPHLDQVTKCGCRIESPKGMEKPATALHWLASSVGDVLLDAVVVTTGSEAYRRADGIAAVPAALLGP